jgi:protein-tyrosine phosphatase
MVVIRRVVICSESRVYWDEGAEPECGNDSHGHRVLETHRHLSPVVLPDGTRLTAASFDPVDPYSRVRSPDYGLYFDSRWQPPWDHGYVDWPDFGVPANSEAVVRALRVVLERARSGQDIEVGCIGGHGRTGTALACLAVLAGHPAVEAVAWVRANYCAKAVETPEQEAFVAGLSES